MAEREKRQRNRNIREMVGRRFSGIIPGWLQENEADSQGRMLCWRKVLKRLLPVLEVY